MKDNQFTGIGNFTGRERCSATTHPCSRVATRPWYRAQTSHALYFCTVYQGRVATRLGISNYFANGNRERTAMPTSGKTDAIGVMLYVASLVWSLTLVTVMV